MQNTERDQPPTLIKDRVEVNVSDRFTLLHDLEQSYLYA